MNINLAKLLSSSLGTPLKNLPNIPKMFSDAMPLYARIRNTYYYIYSIVQANLCKAIFTRLIR